MLDLTPKDLPPPSLLVKVRVFSVIFDALLTLYLALSGARKIKALEPATAAFPNGIQDTVDAAVLLRGISSPALDIKPTSEYFHYGSVTYSSGC